MPDEEGELAPDRRSDGEPVLRQRDVHMRESGGGATAGGCEPADDPDEPTGETVAGGAALGGDRHGNADAGVRAILGWNLRHEGGEAWAPVIGRFLSGAGGTEPERSGCRDRRVSGGCGESSQPDAADDGDWSTSNGAPT